MPHFAHPRFPYGHGINLGMILGVALLVLADYLWHLLWHS